MAAETYDPIDSAVQASGPAGNAKVVEPGAEYAETQPGATLYIGTGGDLVVGMLRNKTEKITFKNIPDGSWLPIRVSRVYGSGDGTTATDILAVW